MEMFEVRLKLGVLSMEVLVVLARTDLAEIGCVLSPLRVPVAPVAMVQCGAGQERVESIAGPGAATLLQGGGLQRSQDGEVHVLELLSLEEQEEHVLEVLVQVELLVGVEVEAVELLPELLALAVALLVSMVVPLGILKMVMGLLLVETGPQGEPKVAGLQAKVWLSWLRIFWVAPSWVERSWVLPEPLPILLEVAMVEVEVVPIHDLAESAMLLVWMEPALSAQVVMVIGDQL